MATSFPCDTALRCENILEIPQPTDVLIADVAEKGTKSSLIC
jgi:hypothetical protein